MKPFAIATLSIASLSTVLSIGTLVAPALAQQRVCDFGVGGVGINCRTEYPDYGYRDNYRSNDYRNNDYRYNRRVTNSQARIVINDFYRQYLGRDADQRGLRDYLDQYRSGRSLEAIRRAIASSQEARNYRNSAGYNFR
jgi:hypothetical protein